jgi:hypothetical protein
MGSIALFVELSANDKAAEFLEAGAEHSCPTISLREGRTQRYIVFLKGSLSTGYGTLMFYIVCYKTNFAKPLDSR